MPPLTGYDSGVEGGEGRDQLEQTHCVRGRELCVCKLSPTDLMSRDLYADYSCYHCLTECSPLTHMGINL